MTLEHRRAARAGEHEQVGEAVRGDPEVGLRAGLPVFPQPLPAGAFDVEPEDRPGHRVEAGGEDDDVGLDELAAGQQDAVRRDPLDGVRTDVFQAHVGPVERLVVPGVDGLPLRADRIDGMSFSAVTGPSRWRVSCGGRTPPPLRWRPGRSWCPGIRRGTAGRPAATAARSRLALLRAVVEGVLGPEDLPQPAHHRAVGHLGRRSLMRASEVADELRGQRRVPGRDAELRASAAAR